MTTSRASFAECAREARIDRILSRHPACLGDDHALARCQPVRLDDDGQFLPCQIGLGGHAHRRIGRRRRSGSLNSRQRSLVKPLEPSSCAAALEGPNTLILAAVRSSTMPATRGTSGPTTTKSISILLRRTALHAVWSATLSATQVATLGNAGIAGRAIELGQASGLADSAQASACSRPPEPMRRTFINENSTKALESCPELGPVFAVLMYHLKRSLNKARGKSWPS